MMLVSEIQILKISTHRSNDSPSDRVMRGASVDR